MFWANTCAALTTAALAATASAMNRSGPYHLQLTGRYDKGLSGYAVACHAGAAIQGLCFAAGAIPATKKYVYDFYYQYGSHDFNTGTPQQPGWLSYLDTATDTNMSIVSIELSMRLDRSWVTNVAPALFGPDDAPGANLYYVPDSGELYANGFDDLFATPTLTKPLPVANFTNFHLCYQNTNGYWYRSVAWAYSLPPRNPTCVPVSLNLVSCGGQAQ